MATPATPIPSASNNGTNPSGNATVSSASLSGSPSVTNVPITSTSISLLTSASTVTITSDNSTHTTVVPTTTSIPISIVTVTPSTVYVTPSSIPVVTSIVTATPSPSNGSTQSAQIVTVTSTYSSPPRSSSSTSSTSSAQPSTVNANGDASAVSSGGLGSGGKIAIAVIIPLVVIAAAFMLGLCFWRKRRERNSEAELRKNEMAEYGFNPNSDPTLVPVSTVYGESKSDADNEGYRGWGATATSTRKASTTLGSNGRPMGNGLSDTNSSTGGYGYQGVPNSNGHNSVDPLMHGGHGEGADGFAALGGAAVAAGIARRKSQKSGGLKRGPSNASSTYSMGAPMSEASSDAHISSPAHYQEEVPYNIYTDTQSHMGPYGDNPYSMGGQPVIRDVQARRNTKIERAPTFPQNQGGIAQNF